MDPTSSTSGVLLQNALPPLDPADHSSIQVVAACQEAIIHTYQECIAVLQTANEQEQRLQHAPTTVARILSESTLMV